MKMAFRVSERSGFIALGCSICSVGSYYAAMLMRPLTDGSTMVWAALVGLTALASAAFVLVPFFRMARRQRWLAMAALLLLVIGEFPLLVGLTMFAGGLVVLVIPLALLGFVVFGSVYLVQRIRDRRRLRRIHP